MYRKLFITILIAFLILGYLHAQDFIWERSYPWHTNDQRIYWTPFDICIAENNNILLGGLRHIDNSESDFWMMKTDGSGDSLWQRSYIIEHREERCWILMLTNGNYLLTGTYHIIQLDRHHWRALCVNSDGDSLWYRDYEHDDDIMQNAIATSDGGFLLMGWTTRNRRGALIGWAVKCDSSGDIQWEIREYVGTSNPYFHALELDDQELLIWGIYDDNERHSEIASVVRINSDGEEIWRQVYGADDYTQIEMIYPTEGGFEYFGQFGHEWRNNLSGWHVLVNEDGELIEEEFYDWDPGIPADTCEIRDRAFLPYYYNGSIAVGATQPLGGRAYIARRDLLGNVLWYYQNQWVEESPLIYYGSFKSVVITDEMDYLIVGSGGEHGTALIKIRDEFNYVTPLDDPIAEVFLLNAAYPNPFNSAVKLYYFLGSPCELSIRIYDNSGRKIKETFQRYKTSGHYTFTWSPLNLANGKYFIAFNGQAQTEIVPVIFLK